MERQAVATPTRAASTSGRQAGSGGTGAGGPTDAAERPLIKDGSYAAAATEVRAVGGRRTLLALPAEGSGSCWVELL